MLQSHKRYYIVLVGLFCFPTTNDRHFFGHFSAAALSLDNILNPILNKIKQANGPEFFSASLNNLGVKPTLAAYTKPHNHSAEEAAVQKILWEQTWNTVGGTDKQPI